MNTARQRLGARCRAERIHRFGAVTFHRRNPIRERTFHSKSGNVAGSVAALQDLAEHSTVHRQVAFENFHFFKVER